MNCDHLYNGPQLKRELILEGGTALRFFAISVCDLYKQPGQFFYRDRSLQGNSNRIFSETEIKCNTIATVSIAMVAVLITTMPLIVALWSSGRHLASGSEGPGFESWLCQVDVEFLGKALYMHFPHPTHVKNENPTIGSMLE